VRCHSLGASALRLPRPTSYGLAMPSGEKQAGIDDDESSYVIARSAATKQSLVLVDSNGHERLPRPPLDGLAMTKGAKGGASFTSLVSLPAT